MRQNIVKFMMALLLAAGLRAAAEVTPVWSVGAAVPGEQVMLYLVDAELGEDTFDLRSRLAPRNATVQVSRPRMEANPLDPNRSMAEVLPILVRPDKAGILELGELEVKYRSGKTGRVRIPALPVLSTAEVQWYNDPVPYGVLWYTVPKDGYVHQPVRAALKVFLPMDCYARSLPQLHSVGVKISTLQPTLQGMVAMVQNSIMEDTTAFARRQVWRTADFAGELTPFREGNSDIIGKLLVAQQRGIFTLGQSEIPLSTLTLSALPLPPGAPAQFADTVGQYTISSKTSADALAMNETVEVEITVRGSGNLQQLACPVPEDAESWRLVPATRKPIVSVGGETVGMVFTQLMRPVAEVEAIPSFVLRYFDPKAMEYKRAATAPIALPWHETDSSGAGMPEADTEPPPAGRVPTAEMKDIYGYLPVRDGGSVWVWPRWLLYLLYAPALGVLLPVAGRRIRRAVLLRAFDRTRERELSSIAHEQNARNFLKRMGAFVETHLSVDARSVEVQDILRRRDDEAFRPGAAPQVGAAERQAMLRSVRKALAKTGGRMLVLTFALLPVLGAADAPVDPAEATYNNRRYSKALEQLRSFEKQLTPADPCADRVAYNIGNCLYRLDKPGPAALAYARALQINPAFPEARANLAFIQRKEGSLLPVHAETEKVFTLFSCGQLWVLSIFCTAALAFFAALLLLRRARLRGAVQCGVAVSAVGSLFCLVNWVYYITRETPDLSSLPPTDIAYVLRETPLLNAAAADSAAVMRLPAATPLHLLVRRGSYCYAETMTGVRGWVATDDAETLLPGGEAPRLPISLRLR